MEWARRERDRASNVDRGSTLMRFRDAVDSVSSLQGKSADGLGALRGADSGRIKSSTPRKIRGSIDLDGALESRHPNAHRWDYGVGFMITDASDRIIWVEVHSANSLHVEAILQKLRWLKGWLLDEGRPLAEFRSTFVWLSTGRVAIPPKSPEATKLRGQGLVLAGQVLVLDTIP